MIQKSRVQYLNENHIRSGKYVIYWMQASQRTIDNHAFNHAIHIANKYKKPLLVFFGITSSYPEANLRHYYFMLEGLQDVKKNLDTLHIPFIIAIDSPEKGLLRLATDACCVVVDRGYLRIQKRWRSYAAEKLKCPLIQVETDVVVPIEIVTHKEEYAAATIRPKISRFLSEYLIPLGSISLKNSSNSLEKSSEDISDIRTLLKRLGINASVSPSKKFHGGQAEANKKLRFFINHILDDFVEERNDPSKNAISHMSPYLHFGHISPITIALAIHGAQSPGEEAYLEELIIRRELAMNYVHFNQNYDDFSGLPSWAKQSLRHHKHDTREYSYPLSMLEHAETHDSYWNAAQNEMVKTGKMHGYMRMYWGKKIIEWTDSPEKAYGIALYLNNKYELDGRDPNGYTGVAWCFGKHDRAWKERPVFGKIRYMNAAGLKRKFPISVYVEKINLMS